MGKERKIREGFQGVFVQEGVRGRETVGRINSKGVGKERKTRSVFKQYLYRRR